MDVAIRNVAAGPMSSSSHGISSSGVSRQQDRDTTAASRASLAASESARSEELPPGNNGDRPAPNDNEGMGGRIQPFWGKTHRGNHRASGTLN